MFDFRQDFCTTCGAKIIRCVTIERKEISLDFEPIADGNWTFGPGMRAVYIGFEMSDKPRYNRHSSPCTARPTTDDAAKKTTARAKGKRATK